MTTIPKIGNKNRTIRSSPAICFAGNPDRPRLIWLLLCECQLGGTIIFVDAHIHYTKPVIGRLGAVADLGSSLSESLDRLAQGRKARMQLEVVLYGNDIKGAIFEGVYLMLPPLLDIPLARGGLNAG